MQPGRDLFNPICNWTNPDIQSIRINQPRYTIGQPGLYLDVEPARINLPVVQPDSLDSAPMYYTIQPVTQPGTLDFARCVTGQDKFARCTTGQPGVRPDV